MNTNNNYMLKGIIVLIFLILVSFMFFSKGEFTLKPYKPHTGFLASHPTTIPIVSGIGFHNSSLLPIS